MGSSLASKSIEETLKLAREMASELLPGDVVCLRGDLGAGKTTFAKGLVSTLTGDYTEDDVSSPTFVTMNLYNHVAHFDLYRLESLEAFLQSGFDEYLEEPYIAIVEWPELIEKILPTRAKQVIITADGEGSRVFT